MIPYLKCTESLSAKENTCKPLKRRLQYNKFCFWVLIAISVHPAVAQRSGQSDLTVLRQKEYFDQENGPDYNLQNGICYVDLYTPARGHPYFGEKSYNTGSIVISGTEYPEVKLKYDICNQRVQLYYVQPSGESDQIILCNEFIERFSFDGKLFRKLFFNETGEQYFQVIEAGNIVCLYYHRKTMSFHNTTTSVSYVYSHPGRKAYLLIDGSLHQFWPKGSFVRIFPKEHRKNIRRYIRKNRFFIKNITDREMLQLLNYCNAIMDNGQ